MQVRRHRLQIVSQLPIEVVDITERVRAWVRETGIRDGLLTLISLHTTARMHVNERDAALQRDMVDFLTRLVPREGPYAHNVDTVDGRDNAHAHLLGLFVNASETIPVTDGDLLLGSWQSLFFIELDGPRAQREVQLQLLGVE
jgi:secondary thiamine-phosphate synthase enzyme